MTEVLSRKERMQMVFNYLKDNKLIQTQKDLANQMESTQPNVSSALNGDERVLTDSFLIRLNASYDNIFNKEWLLVGKGEMLRSDITMIQKGNGGNRQQGRAGVDLTQNINSEKIFKDFIAALKSQNEVALKSMEQTNKALSEISKQREQMDRLISMIENLQNSKG